MFYTYESISTVNRLVGELVRVNLTAKTKQDYMYRIQRFIELASELVQIN